MTFHKLLVAALAITLSSAVFAQDKIQKTDGDVINGKVIEVDKKVVLYTRADNANGPEYSINKSEISKITYANGTEDVFDEVGMKRPRRPRGPHMPEMAAVPPSLRHLKHNIIAFAPFQFTESGLGCSVSYERTFGTDGVAGLFIPVQFIINPDNSGEANGVYNSNHINTVFYAMPGFKFYPTGSNGRVKYAVGPSLVVASGNEANFQYDMNGNVISERTNQIFKFGVMINNYLNINPTPHLFVGIDFGLGGAYINTVNGISQGTSVLVQGSFRVGYRF